MFNGETSTVAVPCKYRLADIQCGDYHLRVTPGSQLDSNNTFCQNPEDGFGGICMGPNNVRSFAKGQSPSISPL